ncbi:MAG: alanine racemase [Candidatus Sericytochromatia bacterium]|nr:alanine racemase [Candidatus Tanganyikabacteria bacterium]
MDLLPEHHSEVLAPYLGFGGAVLVDGTSAESLASTLGTPAYVYSGSVISRRIAELRRAMPAGLSLHYAVKANPNKEVLAHIAGLVDGFDVASGGEVERLAKAGWTLSEVSFAGPGKSRDELSRAVSLGVRIVVESPHQLLLTNSVARELGRMAPVMVRLNDHREVRNGGLTMSGGSVFGWDLEDYVQTGPDLFSSLSHVAFEGFHLFHGTQILQATALAEGLRTSAELLRTVPVPANPVLINLGGGLGLPYGPKDVPLNPRDLTTAWTEACRTIRSRFPAVRICVELGRYLVGPAGVYLTRVVDKKMAGDRRYIVTDGGLHHFLAATGNFGQVFRRNHPVWPANPRDGEPETVSVVGRLCTPIDVFARDVTLAPVEIGDILVLFQAGAYGFTASPRDFLSHAPPVERFLKG